MLSARRRSKSLCLVVFLVCFVVVLFSLRCLGQDSRIRNLFSADSTVRGAAKDELLNHPDPALLPGLLQALPSSTGSNRDDLLEVLAKYHDPRKIPIYIALAKASKFNTWPQEIGDQLAKLGAPAAQALLDGCAGEGEDYATWAGVTIGWMRDAGTRFLIEAAESTDECQHDIGDNGLKGQFGDADRQSPYRAEVELAINAVIDPDLRIREAVRRLFDSWKDKKQEEIDFSNIVEALIGAYQAQAPAETMVKIAQMLADIQVPRVTRFMRAAIHAPNADIQQTARDYLVRLPVEAKPQPAGSRTPKTPEAKIEYLKQLPMVPNVNSKIVPFLHDADVKVRAQAAEVLGDHNAFSNDSRDEREADPETALPGLRLALKDPEPEVRTAAIDAIDKIRSDSDTALLVEALHDPMPSVVLAAAKAVADFPDPSASPALVEIYKNEKNSPELRYQALETLVNICDPSTTQIFLQGLETLAGSSLTAAEGLVCTLEKQPDPSVFQALRDAEEHVQDMMTREYLIRALGATKNPEALPVLEALGKSHHPELAPAAVEALGALGDRRALPLLAEFLRDSNYKVRESAAFSFSKFSDFTVPPELIGALFDRDAGAGIYVATAITNSHDPKAIDALIARLPDSGAISVLGKSHDTRAFPGILAVLQNPANSTDLRRAAASALGDLGDLRAVDPLIAVLSEDNFSLTQSSIYALAALKDKRAIEPLKQARARWSAGQRQNAQSVQSTIDDALIKLGAADAVPATGSPQ